MGSKLEYWFLLTKIAVVVLVMIEDGIGASSQRLDDSCWISCGMLVVGRSSTYLLKPVNFSKSNFQCGFGFWIFQFTKSPSQLPKIRPIANLLSRKLLRWKLENPKISQLPKILPIHPKISQFPIPLPKSNFQSPKIIQPERYCAGSANYYYLDNKMAYLNLSTVESFK